MVFFFFFLRNSTAINQYILHVQTIFRTGQSLANLLINRKIEAMQKIPKGKNFITMDKYIIMLTAFNWQSSMPQVIAQMQRPLNWRRLDIDPTQGVSALMCKSVVRINVSFALCWWNTFSFTLTQCCKRASNPEEWHGVHSTLLNWLAFKIMTSVSIFSQNELP